MKIDAEDLLQRFLRYVQIETRSDDTSSAVPSTPCQWNLLKLLADELRTLGARDVELTPQGYVLATIPPTSTKPGIPTIAWFAHVDTATNLPGAAKPLVHRAYDGKPIVLPDDLRQRLTVDDIPHLRDAIGHDIVTASGTTLLGADDKAGVAIVMSACRHLLLHPEIPHGRLRICFNPDEEIARGMAELDLTKLGADFGYTLDGETLGELNYETFSADAAILEIEGIAAHPGFAKNRMVNALRLAGRFLAALPMDRAPETTDDRQGFIHPLDFQGSAEKATIRMILRDFELDGLERHRAELRRIVAELEKSAPHARFTLTLREQYRNMRYWLENDMRPVELAQEATRRAGINPLFHPIRGGTDGSNLTARGLLTPNLFTGMHEVHSQREWVSVNDMSKSVETLLHLAQLWEERS